MVIADYPARCIVWVLSTQAAGVERMALGLQHLVRWYGLTHEVTKVCVEIDWDTATLTHEFYEGEWSSPDEHDYALVVNCQLWPEGREEDAVDRTIGMNLSSDVRLAGAVQGILAADPTLAESFIDRVMVFEG
jgi:hypothetical protein